jgi:hypothetical protein
MSSLKDGLGDMMMRVESVLASGGQRLAARRCRLGWEEVSIWETGVILSMVLERCRFMLYACVYCMLGVNNGLDY